MNTKFDTKDWELSVLVGYQLKPDVKLSVACPSCGGKGRVGGGPLYFTDSEDGMDQCPQCWGAGTINSGYQAEPQPELPRGLLAALRATLDAHEPPSGIDHHPD